MLLISEISIHISVNSSLEVFVDGISTISLLTLMHAAQSYTLAICQVLK